jgi:ATP-dependent exoDNAse (exonuclease V) beta subunit
MNLKIISAGAGSGKTYTLTQKMAALLRPDAQGQSPVRASGIIATTFTKDAAAELQERVRVKLLEEGLMQQADDLENALIGTVHSIGVQLLKRFAFEAGVSPKMDIIMDTDHQMIFNQSLSTILTDEVVERMNELSLRLGMQGQKGDKDWRNELKELIDHARINGLGLDGLEQSRNYSLQTFFELLPQASSKTNLAWTQELTSLLSNTRFDLQNNDDTTKKKQELVDLLKQAQTDLQQQGFLPWHVWVKMLKACQNASKKSKDQVQSLATFLQAHDSHQGFHEDIRQFINLLFELAAKAIREYEQYKKTRGLIDYNDMELLLLGLLENESVLAVLREELDLLLVDEFQDTSPIQLKIFLRLSQLAKQSIWVGDPKQSIYGFRGAAPELMEAILEKTKDNLEILTHSWRSRADLVNAVNGLFVRALAQMPPERIVLKPAPSSAKEQESPLLDPAIWHWLLVQEAEKPKVNGDWIEAAIARSLKQTLEQGLYVRERGKNTVRPLCAGDIAILCRSNQECADIAQALSKEGIKASIARSGLLATAEIGLVLACLKFVLNRHDALSIAELMLLGEHQALEEIIGSRVQFLEELKQNSKSREDQPVWGANQVEIIKQLNTLRRQMQEMSASEILNLIIQYLDLRRRLAAWSNPEQRLNNLEALRSLALEYEETCNRLHTAATLGGFLLWLTDLEREKRDNQGMTGGEEVIQVMTYHKSKGLEWPMVVCYGLHASFRDDVLGIKDISLQQEVDLSDPLAGRLVRYWPNPYGQQLAKTALEESLENHPAQQKVTEEALAEEARLLYVGLTRARDYLVFPNAPGKHLEWLNRVFHGQKDASKTPTLTHDQHCLPWDWQGQELPLKYQVFKYPETFVAQPNNEEERWYWEQRRGRGEHGVAMLEQAQNLFANNPLKVAQVHFFSQPLALPQEHSQDYEEAASLLQRFMQSDDPQQAYAQRLHIAERWVEQHPCLHLQASELLHFSERLWAQLQKISGSIQKNQRLLPFLYQDGGQYYKGVLDALFQTNQGEYLLLQYSNTANLDLNKRKTKALEESHQLLAAQASLAQHLPKGNYRYFILAAAEGLLLELQ